MDTIPALLARRGREEGGRTALLTAGGRSLTFAEWDERANAIAHGLLDRDVRRGDRIGLRFGDEEWSDLAAVYAGVLRAGAVAVPLSDRLPPARAVELLEQVSAAGLVHGECPAPGSGGAWETGVAALERAASAPVDVGIRPDDPAQVLFTSGTTAAPRAVIASHRNVAHWPGDRAAQRPLAHSEHLVHAFPVGTNAAQHMLLHALVAHPRVLCAGSFEPDRFAAAIEAHRVGSVFLVPATAIALLQAGSHERHDLSSVLLVTSTGSALPPAVAAALSAALPNATIVNVYTSTEAAPAETALVFDPDRPLSVGRPFRPGHVRVTGADGAPLGPGVTGEVWLRSEAPPRSYLGDPGATAAVFRDGWTRMGDLGYLDGGGYLHLVDREGDLIQSGAFRVSTIAVEAALHEHARVAEAAVVGVPHPVLGTAVAAAVVLRAPEALDDLRAFLGARLAPHERPALLRAVGSIPRNPAGKPLKGELRRLLTAATPTGSTPASPTEARLREVWTRLLDRDAIGGGDDFFALGGDSLKASQLVGLVTRAMHVEVPISLAYDFPVLARQAAAIDAARPAIPAAGSPAGAHRRAQEVLLGAMQEYFLRWMHEAPEPRAVSAVNVGIRIRDALDVDALARSLDDLADRHEALRTVFARGPGGFTGRLLAGCGWPLVTLRAGGGSAAEREAHALQLACEEVARPFDVERGPLLRAVAVHLGPLDHVFVLAASHIVCDGWSMGVLLRELALLYSAHRAGRRPVLPSPPQGPALFADERRRWATTRPFWRRALDGAPNGFARAPGRREARSLSARSHGFRLPAEAASRLASVARDHAVTPFMVVVAAWSAVLRAWTGQADVVLMSPVAGRPRPELEAVVGCLVQSLLLRVDAGADPEFRDLVARVRETVLAATAHQHYPYEELSRAVRWPAWVRYERWSEPAHLPGLESEPFDLPLELMFDWPLLEGETDEGVPELRLIAQPDGSIACWLIYNRHAFEPAAVEGLAGAFLGLVERACGDPRLRLSALAGTPRIG